MGKDLCGPAKGGNEDSAMQLKKNIGYFEGVTFIMGMIIGAGIFVSPTGVLKCSLLNVGVALIIWTICGFISLMGALCYAELGTALPVSGGEYSHIKRALGSPLAFIFLWTAIFNKPASNAARALLFAEYAIQPFYEEMKNPSKNIPQTVMTALPSVTVFYLLVNVSYLTVLTPKEIVSSVAVAVTWADKVIPSVAWIVPVSVAISIFGALNSSMFTLGRLSYAGSQSGHLPVIISMLNVHYLTPAPAMIFSTVIASIFIIPSDISALMNYFGFSLWLMIGLTCASLIVLRYREPNLHRPYKVFLPAAYSMVAISLFLVCVPIVWSPKVQYIYAFLFMLGGLLLYLPFVHFKIHFKFVDKITCYLQLLLEVSHANHKCE